MPHLHEQTEKDAQSRIARKYRTLGYEVLENPGPDRLPDFMHGVTPDIIAQSRRDNVVIEIKRHASLKGSNDLVGIAERVSGRPDWRFELVVFDDADDVASPLPGTDYEHLWNMVRIANRHGLFEMAYAYLIQMIACTVQSLAKKNQISLREKSDRTLLLDLGFRGIVPDRLLEQCLSALSTRNNLIHSFDQSTSVSQQDVLSLTALAVELRQLS